MSSIGFKGIENSLQTLGMKWNKSYYPFFKELWEEGYRKDHVCYAMSENKEKLIKAVEVGNFWAKLMQVISECPSSHNNITALEYGELWQAKKRNEKAIKYTGFSILNGTPKHTECVYFVQSVDGGPIKIGYSNDLVQRIRTLQNYYKKKFNVLLVIPGTRQTEKDLHKKLARHRVKGEWFKPSKRVLETIEELRAAS